MIALAVCVAIASCAGIYGVFEKAGIPGWHAFVPIYNVVLVLWLVGKPYWWIWLFFVPGVNVVIRVLVSMEIAARFGKGPLFGVGLVFLPFVLYPVLGFGSASYQRPRQ